jgi:hypothetical protein
MVHKVATGKIFIIAAMMMESTAWRITCRQVTFEACLKKDKSPYRRISSGNECSELCALASALSGETNTPDARRDRLNSYFFASGLLYEALGLIKRMNKTFKDDPLFQGGTAALIERQDGANDGAGKSRPFMQWRCISLPARAVRGDGTKSHLQRVSVYRSGRKPK